VRFFPQPVLKVLEIIGVDEHPAKPEEKRLENSHFFVRKTGTFETSARRKFR
jgi:hypothetical protein